MTLPTTPSFRLDGRHALVIGGTSGIGLGCAVALAEAGARVTVMARGAEQLESVVSEMNAAGFAATPIVGDITDTEAFHHNLHARYPYLPRPLLDDLADRHGVLCNDILEGCSTLKDLGKDFGGGLTEREVAWLQDNEWAQTAEDILWRRTKCGLHMSPEQRDRFASYM